MRVVHYDASLLRLASSFDSNNCHLDIFLRSNDALDRGIGKTFVLLADDNSRIIGYYNISTGYIERKDFGRRIRIGGSIHINAFALDVKFQKWRYFVSDGNFVYLSDVLFDSCMRTIRHIREEYVGFSFVTLSSTEAGLHLYKRNGFEELDNDMEFCSSEEEVECTKLYLPLDFE